MTLLVPRLLVVDDEASVRDVLAEGLREIAGDVLVASDFTEAFRVLESKTCDVVLADICMPGCSGMDLLYLAQEFGWDCSVILMSGHASLEQVANSVRLHAADFLVKPFSMDRAVNSVAEAYRKVLLRRAQSTEHIRLSQGLRERSRQLELAQSKLRGAYRSALETMIVTLEAREPGTYAHSFRVRAYALHLADLMNYPENLKLRLAYAALLHDVGKIAVSDSILLKPGKLNAEEFSALQVHSAVGERIVRRMGFLDDEATIIRHHHERWDGRGYPDGLSGTDIPLGSRLFAVVDTLDAMTSDRCYRRSLQLSDAQQEIAVCAGKQFDPEIADVFQSVQPGTWRDLREQADDCAHAAAVPDFSRDSFDAFVPELVAPFPIADGL